jgi:Histone chaperone domain CHZ
MMMKKVSLRVVCWLDEVENQTNFLHAVEVDDDDDEDDVDEDDDEEEDFSDDDKKKSKKSKKPSKPVKASKPSKPSKPVSKPSKSKSKKRGSDEESGEEASEVSGKFSTITMGNKASNLTFLHSTEEELDFLDKSVIISSGRRTRGKKIDYTQFGADEDEDEE